jgi:membrane-associated phospholipid phosphatase
LEKSFTFTKIKKNAVFIAIGIAILATMPQFFSYLQQRQGVVLHDPLLAAIPATDLSIPIFVCIHFAAIWFIYKVYLRHVDLFLFLRSYAILLFVRAICLYFVALEPPLGLVNLSDPVLQVFYGNNTITKDLFFSGHTASMFLIYLCYRRPMDKFLSAIVTTIVAIGVLVQHVHYTIDVLVAFPAAYIVYFISKKFD